MILGRFTDFVGTAFGVWIFLKNVSALMSRKKISRSKYRNLSLYFLLLAFLFQK